MSKNIIWELREQWSDSVVSLMEHQHNQTLFFDACHQSSYTKFCAHCLLGVAESGV
ncbi:hypothetical protein PVA45_08335 (plasmid) [Entomospira entomophila]|uniref:Uncharacterized protein n=1 Tax=Entomospira entomophila TaxID=2719988 RepID=A0A968KSA8_9SPIO|nr:hypothetical protein [Entomospira entomophilus]NIZ41534.1 hypothetical protein [Entomospira entomophilus]WDI36438.1 hypothetical protein PVA45_08335 [Entomospira entomophilus]